MACDAEGGQKGIRERNTGSDGLVKKLRRRSFPPAHSLLENFAGFPAWIP